MADFWKSIFGGEDEPAQTVREPYGSWNPEQVRLGKSLGTNLYNWSQSGLPAYTGQLNAPISPETLSTIANAGRLNALLGEGYERGLSGFPEEYFNQAYTVPIQKDFTNYVLPLINEAYAGPEGSGYFGSTRGDRLMREYQAKVADPIAKARGEWGLTTLEWPFKYGPSIMQSQLTGTALQDYPRVIAQEGLTRDYDEWIRRQPGSRENVDAMLRFLGIPTGTYTTTPPPSYSGGLFGNILGTLGTSWATNWMDQLFNKGGTTPTTEPAPYTYVEYA